VKRRGNRVGLALIGLVLLAIGGLSLARGLGAFGVDAARRPVLERGTTALASGRPAFWPAVAAVGVVLALIGLAWLFTLMHLDRVRRIRLQAGASGVTEVEGAPVGRALADQVSTYPAVRRAHAVLRGRADAPRLDLGVTAGGPADLSDLVTKLHEEAVPDLRTTLGLNRLPTLVRLNVVPGRRTREVH
jgi:hypothetical protein